MKQLLAQRKTQILVGVVGAIILLTVCASVLLYSIYIRRSDASIVRRLGWSFPVARVGSRTVTYGDFLDSRDAIRVYMKSDAAKSAGMSGDLTATGEQNAYERLVHQAVLEELAVDRKITVSDEDARVSFAQLVASASTTLPNVSQYLQDTFHWNEDQFRQKVIKPAILEEQLANSFSSSTGDQIQQLDDYVTARLAKPDVKRYLTKF